MEKEYSNEIRGKVHAYRFLDFEKIIIAEASKKEIIKLEKEIKKIHNHPKNEGQASYSCQIDELVFKITLLNDMVREFSPKNYKP